MGAISFTGDVWDSKSRTAYLGVTAHWISPGVVMTSAVVGFKHIPGRHTGPDLARVMFDVLEKAEVTNNVSSSLIASNIWTNIFYR